MVLLSLQHIPDRIPLDRYCYRRLHKTPINGDSTVQRDCLTRHGNSAPFSRVGRPWGACLTCVSPVPTGGARCPHRRYCPPAACGIHCVRVHPPGLLQLTGAAVSDRVWHPHAHHHPAGVAALPAAEAPPLAAGARTVRAVHRRRKGRRNRQMALDCECGLEIGIGMAE